MAGAIVTFDYQEWALRYPEFNDTVDPELAALYFAEATIYHANDGSGPVTDAAQQKILLYMIVAHVAQLNKGSSIQSLSPLAGPITNASEGSVSVGAQLPQVPGSQAWFILTRYGYNYWFATAAFRTMRYTIGPRRTFNPPGYPNVFVRG